MLALFAVLITLAAIFFGVMWYTSVIRYGKLLVFTEAYVQFLTAVYFKTKNSRDKMKEVDKRGSFAADDEVGFIFKELDAQVDELYEFITKYVNTNNDNEETKS
jgi:SPX domain protein involved in polyphosphate accumulation